MWPPTCGRCASSRTKIPAAILREVILDEFAPGAYPAAHLRAEQPALRVGLPGAPATPGYRQLDRGCRLRRQRRPGRDLRDRERRFRSDAGRPPGRVTGGDGGHGRQRAFDGLRGLSCRKKRAGDLRSRDTPRARGAAGPSSRGEGGIGDLLSDQGRAGGGRGKNRGLSGGKPGAVLTHYGGRETEPDGGRPLQIPSPPRSPARSPQPLAPSYLSSRSSSSAAILPLSPRPSYRSLPTSRSAPQRAW